MNRGACTDGARSRAGVALAAALFVSAGLGSAGAPAVARELGSGACRTPDTLLGKTYALPRVAARLAAGEPLRIVAIGSSSTGGAGASSPARAYPARLREALARRFPASAIAVLNKGVNGQRAPAMLARFERDVFAERPDLVIWQLGTNSIIQGDGVAGNEALIREGIDRLRAAMVDIMLIDPQFAPKVTADPDHADMLRIIAEVGQSEQVTVFPRFAVMHHWVSSGQATLGDVLSPDGLHMNDLSYDCLGVLIADQIDIAVGSAARRLIAAPQPRP